MIPPLVPNKFGAQVLNRHINGRTYPQTCELSAWQLVGSPPCQLTPLGSVRNDIAAKLCQTCGWDDTVRLEHRYSLAAGHFGHSYEVCTHPIQQWGFCGVLKGQNRNIAYISMVYPINVINMNWASPHGQFAMAIGAIVACVIVDYSHVGLTRNCR